MSILGKAFGPVSKYDKSLPYTYMAKVATVDGIEDLHSYYFADTICGLIEYLDNHQIRPQEVELFGFYRKTEIPLEVEYCIDPDQNWLERPKICQSLESRYIKTLEDRYKGHVEKGSCLFEDRNRKGRGSGVM